MWIFKPHTVRIPNGRFYIVSDVSVSAGCIVSKDIYETGFYVSSSLVRKGAVLDYSKNVNTIIYEGARFYKRE